VWVAEDAHTGRAFVADGSSTGLRVLDARNGHLLRIILSGQHAAQVVVDERADRAFVSTPAGMSVLDTRSGAVLRSIAMGGYPGEMLVDARDGRVFVVPPYTARGGQNVLSVLDARGGTLVRTVTLAGSAGAIAVDERAQRVLVFTVTRTGVPPATTGTMTILDARSGAILRVMPAHVPGAWMAVVDERTGHVFVLDGPHTVALPDPWTWLPVWLRRRLPLVPAPGRYTRVVPGGVRMIDSMR
jgi:DNA-binding beta-propeller fold protein YncE